MYKRKPIRSFLFLLTIAVLTIGIASCSSSSASNVHMGQMEAPSLPVLALAEQPATVYQEYSASLEGSKDIEIRPQVEGYIETIYVDEGAYVRKGQLLFKINDRIYREQVNTAKAALAAARANLATAEINVEKVKPLVQNNIVSNVQLQSAQAAYNAAAAQVSQAEAMLRNAEINLGYTLIKAPVDGYIGRIPLKTGSLVGMTTPEPLTVLSELATVHAYFSLSENDFIRFREQYPGNTIEEKIAKMAPVELILADGTPYPHKGKVELATGQFREGMGSIEFRAVFPNPNGQLRSGNTGKIRLPLSVGAAVLVPHEATFELQDKIFVFQLGDSNKVNSTPIDPAGSTGNYYLVQKGLQPGSRIVYSGFDRLRDGAVIQPQTITMDSLMNINQR